MLQSAGLVAFAASADLDRSREFYQDILGLTLVSRDDFACVFDAAGTVLRVTAVPEPARAVYTVLGWEVPDITATASGLAGRGVTFLRYDVMSQDADGIWTAPGGARIAWFPDPDGNILSLTQYPPGTDKFERHAESGTGRESTEGLAND